MHRIVGRTFAAEAVDNGSELGFQGRNVRIKVRTAFGSDVRRRLLQVLNVLRSGVEGFVEVFEVVNGVVVPTLTSAAEGSLQGGGVVAPRSGAVDRGDRIFGIAVGIHARGGEVGGNKAILVSSSIENFARISGAGGLVVVRGTQQVGFVIKKGDQLIAVILVEDVCTDVIGSAFAAVVDINVNLDVKESAALVGAIQKVIDGRLSSAGVDSQSDVLIVPAFVAHVNIAVERETIRTPAGIAAVNEPLHLNVCTMGQSGAFGVFLNVANNRSIQVAEIGLFGQFKRSRQRGANSTAAVFAGDTAPFTGFRYRGRTVADITVEEGVHFGRKDLTVSHIRAKLVGNLVGNLEAGNGAGSRNVVKGERNVSRRAVVNQAGRDGADGHVRGVRAIEVIGLNARDLILVLFVLMVGAALVLIMSPHTGGTVGEGEGLVGKRAAGAVIVFVQADGRSTEGLLAAPGLDELGDNGKGVAEQRDLALVQSGEQVVNDRLQVVTGQKGRDRAKLVVGQQVVAGDQIEDALRQFENVVDNVAAGQDVAQGLAVGVGAVGRRGVAAEEGQHAAEIEVGGKVLNLFDESVQVEVVAVAGHIADEAERQQTVEDVVEFAEGVALAGDGVGLKADKHAVGGFAAKRTVARGVGAADIVGAPGDNSVEHAHPAIAVNALSRDGGIEVGNAVQVIVTKVNTHVEDQVDPLIRGVGRKSATGGGGEGTAGVDIIGVVDVGSNVGDQLLDNGSAELQNLKAVVKVIGAVRILREDHLRHGILGEQRQADVGDQVDQVGRRILNGVDEVGSGSVVFGIPVHAVITEDGAGVVDKDPFRGAKKVVVDLVIAAVIPQIVNAGDVGGKVAVRFKDVGVDASAQRGVDQAVERAEDGAVFGNQCGHAEVCVFNIVIPVDKLKELVDVGSVEQIIGAGLFRLLLAVFVQNGVAAGVEDGALFKVGIIIVITVGEEAVVNEIVGVNAVGELIISRFRRRVLRQVFEVGRRDLKRIRAHNVHENVLERVIDAGDAELFIRDLGNAIKDLEDGLGVDVGQCTSGTLGKGSVLLGNLGAGGEDLVAVSVASELDGLGKFLIDPGVEDLIDGVGFGGKAGEAVAVRIVPIAEIGGRLVIQQGAEDQLGQEAGQILNNIVDTVEIATEKAVDKTAQRDTVAGADTVNDLLQDVLVIIQELNQCIQHVQVAAGTLHRRFAVAAVDGVEIKIGKVAQRALKELEPTVVFDLHNKVVKYVVDRVKMQGNRGNLRVQLNHAVAVDLGVGKKFVDCIKRKVGNLLNRELGAVNCVVLHLVLDKLGMADYADDADKHDKRKQDAQQFS